MKFIKNQSHNKDTFLLCSSRLLERSAYYGLRAIVVLFMIGETIEFDNTEALTIYGLFTGSIVFTQFLGGILGDLLIGNKKAIIIGGVLQAIGAFTFCLGNDSGLYIGLVLMTIGGGFYGPNILSNFGKIYLNKQKLLDSGFTAFYLAINLGAILGILIITQIAENYSYNLGFIISGLLFLFSLFPLLFSNSNTTVHNENNSFSLSKKILYTLSAFILIALFWSIYDMANIKVIDLERQFEGFQILENSSLEWTAYSNTFLILLSGIAVLIWSFIYYSQIIKLMIGFLFMAFGLAILFTIPEIPQENHLIIYILSYLFISLSEIHIAPIIYSIIAKYSNPKYLAILMSLSFIPTKLGLFTVGLFSNQLFENPNFSLSIGVILSSILGFMLFGFMILRRLLK